MTEFNLKITDVQKARLIELLNLVQVKLSEAECLLDLKHRIESSTEDKQEV
jgi:hypothetical protein